MADNPFPKAQATLTEADVIAYFHELQTRGFQVRSYTTMNGDPGYFVEHPDGERPTVVRVRGGWHLSKAPNSRISEKPVWDAADLRMRFDREFGFGDGARPTSIRTQRDSPASNIARIAALISARKVTAVFDPYLDDRGLANLMALVNIAGEWSKPLRLLTGAKGKAKLTETFFRNFFIERSLTGEVRVMASKEHRRFLLLDSAQSVIVGFSWNQPGHAEAVSVDADREDRRFFDTEWATASLVMSV